MSNLGCMLVKIHGKLYKTNGAQMKQDMKIILININYDYEVWIKYVEHGKDKMPSMKISV